MKDQLCNLEDDLEDVVGEKDHEFDAGHNLEFEEDMSGDLLLKVLGDKKSLVESIR